MTRKGFDSMDAKNNTNVDEIIVSAHKAVLEGKYKEAISMVEPLLKKGKKKTLSPKQEMGVRNVLAQGYHQVDDDKAALPHAMRELELTIQLYGKGSKDHATVLQGVGMLETGLKDFKSAKKRFDVAISIYKKLEMEKSVAYGEVLMGHAEMDFDQQRWKEALEGFVEAKIVMDDFKEHPTYGTIVNDMAICYEKLNQWTEALQYFREAVEIVRKLHGDQHPQYATCIFNLAVAYVRIKQPTIAIRGGVGHSQASVWRPAFPHHHYHQRSRNCS